jgi:hypothetical protein
MSEDYIELLKNRGFSGSSQKAKKLRSKIAQHDDGTGTAQ